MRVSVAVVALLIAASTQAVGEANSRALRPWQIVGRSDSGGLSLVTSNQLRPRALVKHTTGSYDLTPVWSPDGTSVAFQKTSSSTHVDIDVIRVSGGTPRKLVHLGSSGVDGLSWAPDGRRLAFLDLSRLSVINADGSGRQVIADGVAEFSWSPDAQKIAYSGQGRLYSTDVDRQTTRLLARGALGAASWSPNGRLIAYKSRCVNPGAADVFCDVALMNADGSVKRLLTRGQPYGPDPVVWSRDSSAILIQARPGIVMLNVRTHAARTLKGFGGVVVLAPSGEAFGVIDASKGLQLVIATLVGRVLERVHLPISFADGYALRLG